MSAISADQLKQIEKNRISAILKKRKVADEIKQSASCSWSASNKAHTACVQQDSSLSLNSNVKSTPGLSANCRLISNDRFIVDMAYHSPSIEVFKTISGKMYDPALKKWTFPLSSYETLVNKLQGIAALNGIPKAVLSAFKNNDVAVQLNNIDLSKIDKVLLHAIFPFQEEGIRFGISKNGRCLIADDMGLGKTIQALGIAHYYKDNWPLVIVCPSSMRFSWEEAIQTYLPSVNPFYITVMTTKLDVINEAQIVICSYDLMKSCLAELLKKKFGAIILDESHSLKSMRTARTKAALELCQKCKNVILLSGTPALSRPEELYSQIIAIDKFSFHNFHEFGMRYCNGRLDKFGWNFSGSSNMEELELFLKKKLMIRRIKSEVITQLPSKIRKAVILNPSSVRQVTKQMKKLAIDLENQNGLQQRSTLLTYYSLTATAKIDAVCEYIKEKLSDSNKFLVFAHHSVIISAICEMLVGNKTDFIKIDGSTNPELRKRLCDKFQTTEDCRVAVLSIKAANCGITLTAAQLVIFAELYWNPGELTQAEDRAHRIGQHDSVVVEYLLAKGTADDHIWTLVQSKLNVLNKAGLSKDSFKEVNTEHLVEKNQLTLDVMFSSMEPMSHAALEENKDDLFDGKDDDFFANIKLEELESQYHLENKKRRTDD